MAAADHLSVPRQHGLFLHHGIDLGDGTIAHYLEGREILRSPLEEFKRGLETSVVEHDRPSPAGVTLRRAMSRIGEQRYTCCSTTANISPIGAKPAGIRAAKWRASCTPPASALWPSAS